MKKLQQPILPPAIIGVLGGGQLGRMFVQSAQSMGYVVWVLDPDLNSPAGQLANRHICVPYTEETALQLMVENCMAITTEFENISSDVLAWLGERVLVAPSADAVAIAQNRILEKNFIEQSGVSVAPYVVICSGAELIKAQSRIDLFPAILKTARMGYDGKGQIFVQTVDELMAAWSYLGKVECVLEKRLHLKFEVSALLARGWDGAVVDYALSQNVHRNGILHTSTVPAPCVDEELTLHAQIAAAIIAEKLGYVGVLCVEFFVLESGDLVVNEVAPRPHNSGHYTMNACLSSQFEQQVRALVGLPLGATYQHSPVVMLNVLGDIWFDVRGEIQMPDWKGVLLQTDSFVHLYGKTEAKLGRKMGHINFVGKNLTNITERCEAAMGLLGVTGGVND